MESTPKKVAKPGLQLVISILVATSLILAELYVMINQPANMVLLVGIAVLVLIAVYFVIDAIVDYDKEKENAAKELYDNIFRSEKASYILLKKKLEEFADFIQTANDGNQTDNSEEIMNAQKALAKVTVSKNRESAEMIADKIAQLENMLENGLASVNVSGIDEEKQDRLFIELNNLEASLNDRMQGLSDKLSGFQEEIERLADHIARINSEAIQTVLNTNSVPVNVTEPVVGLEKEIVLMEDIPAVEVTDDIEFTDLNMGGIEIVSEAELGMSAFADEDVSEDEDILSQLLAAEASIVEDEVDALAELAKAVDEVAEEKKPTPPPAPADNGGKMGQDDIAALIASMTGGDAAPAPVEEKKPTPPPAPADNGGKMGQDDIAALIASMTGN